jgi:hypothetical protein
MGSRAVLTLEALEHYDKKIKDYIDMRLFEVLGDKAEATVDLETGRMVYVLPRNEKEDKYYYPIPYSLFEEENIDD